MPTHNPANSMSLGNLERNVYDGHYRWKVGRHHLARDLPLENNEHENAILRVAGVLIYELPVDDGEDGHVLLLLHHQLHRDQFHCVQVKGGHIHLDRAHLSVKRIS